MTITALKTSIAALVAVLCFSSALNAQVKETAVFENKDFILCGIFDSEEKLIHKYLVDVLRDQNNQHRVSFNADNKQLTLGMGPKGHPAIVEPYIIAIYDNDNKSYARVDLASLVSNSRFKVGQDGYVNSKHDPISIVSEVPGKISIECRLQSLRELLVRTTNNTFFSPSL